MDVDPSRSPRRSGRRAAPRIWITAIVAVTVLAVAVTAVVLTNRHSGARAASTPPVASSPSSSAAPSSSGATVAAPPSSSLVSPQPRSSSPSVSIPPRPPDDRPGPVIVIPGYGGSVSMLDQLASVLRKSGRTTVVLALPDDATGDFRGQEQVLAAQVAKSMGAGASSVDLVGYSAGGIVAALFVADQPSKVRRVVTIGSPLHGTGLAGLAAGFLPSACPQACQEMAPGSAVLKSLSAASPNVTGVPWLSMWTSLDEVVTPADSARFDGADNVELQSICADDQASHTTLPDDALVQGITVKALDSSTLPVPSFSASDCSSLRAPAD